MFKIANDLSGDLNTGIFFPSADTIAFTEGGSEAMRINSSGQVAIGTTASPQAKLGVIIGSTGTAATFGIDGQTINPKLRIDADESNNTVTLNPNYSGATSPALVFKTQEIERMRITNDGKVLIGQKNASAGMLSIGNHINPDDYRLNVEQLSGVKFGGSFYVGGTGAGNQIRFGNDLGTVGSITTNSGATAFNTSSDYRLKENVNYNFDATTRLKQLKPARFNFIADANKTVDGFLAHEVSNIVPEAITGTKDQVEAIGNITDVEGNIIRENVTEPNELPENQTWTQTGTRPVHQGIDQAKLTPILTKALQEAIAKIEQLEARLTALES